MWLLILTYSATFYIDLWVRLNKPEVLKLFPSGHIRLTELDAPFDRANSVAVVPHNALIDSRMGGIETARMC